MINIIKNSNGDTIVEVLIAMVIMSLILTGAYVTSNASLANIRDAQDRVQATAFAQTQVEDLRAQAPSIFAYNAQNLTYANADWLTVAKPRTFCFGYISNDFRDATLSGGYKGNGKPQKPPTTAPLCQNGNANNGTNMAASITSITPSGTPGVTGSFTFKIIVKWAGHSRFANFDQLIIYYRVGIN